MRDDGRDSEELRPLKFRRRFTRQAPGSVLVSMGRTTVLCTCSVEPAVPAFLVGTGFLRAATLSPVGPGGLLGFDWERGGRQVSGWKCLSRTGSSTFSNA